MTQLVNGQFVEDGSAGIEQFTMMSGEHDIYLMKANNLSDIPNRNTARQNLGITVSPLAPLSPHLNDLWIDLDS